MVLASLLLRLVAPLALAADPAPQGWGATDAVWRLEIRDGEPVVVEADYRLQAPDSRSEVLRLAGPQLLLTAVSGPVVATPRGLEIALGPDVRKVEQHLEGLYSAPTDGRFDLDVLPATRARVVVDAPGLDVTIEGAVDGWVGPRDHLTVTWRPRVEAGEVLRESLLAQGEAATVFRAEGGSLLVEGTMRWRVMRGEAKRLTFDAAGLEEIEVAGPGIASWRREGAQVVIEPKAPVKGLFVATLRGRATLGKGERTVPAPQPSGVQRVDRYVTMARSDEGELIPTAMPTSVPLAQLPAWAKNLGDGVPLVAWHGPQAVRVLNGSFESLQGPDTVVTQARYTVAAAREGRLALRMNLRVRNERRQYLHVAAAPGWRPIVVRVGNQPVSGLGDGAGGLYIPLEKSIETVKGLLSFPVDVEWLAVDQAPWEKRGEMVLSVPAIDAPIQAVAWEVHLPRGYRALRAPTSGSGTVLLGDLRGGDELEDQSGYAEQERRKQEVVSSALQNAVSAYKTNDWSTAQRWLDEAKNVDAGNEDAQLLQENLDVIEGRSTRNDLGARRVKDMARARSSGLEEQQVTLEKTAETLYRSGDLEAAEEAFEEALAVAQELKKVEQVEAAEQSTRIVAAQSKLTEIRDRKAKQKSESSFGKGSGASSGSFATGTGSGSGSWPAAKGSVAQLDPEREPDEESEDLDEAGFDRGDDASVSAPPGEPDTGAAADASTLAFEGLDLDGNADIGGLIGGAPGVQIGASGLGMSGSGMGGGGSAEGLGGLGTKGRGAGPSPDVAEAPPAEPAAAEPAPAPVVMDKEFLEKIPAGRSYQSSTSSLRVTTKSGTARREPEAEKKKVAKADIAYDDDEESDAPARAESRTVAAPKSRPAPAKPVAPAAPAASAPPPAPPPPPPPATASGRATARMGPALGKKVEDLAPIESEEVSVVDGRRRELDSRPPADALETLGYVDDPVPSAGEALPSAPEGATLGALRDDLPAPPPIPRPRPPPERRKALEVNASPMALALPLDGPTVTTTQALLPAGELPTFHFRYRILPSENDR